MSEPVESVGPEPEDIKPGTAPEVMFGWSEEDHQMLVRVDASLQKFQEWMEAHPDSPVPETQKDNISEAVEGIASLSAEASPEGTDESPEPSRKRRSAFRNKRKAKREARRQ